MVQKFYFVSASKSRKPGWSTCQCMFANVYLACTSSSFLFLIVQCAKWRTCQVALKIPTRCRINDPLVPSNGNLCTVREGQVGFLLFLVREFRTLSTRIFSCRVDGRFCCVAADRPVRNNASSAQGTECVEWLCPEPTVLSVVSTVQVVHGPRGSLAFCFLLRWTRPDGVTLLRLRLRIVYGVPGPTNRLPGSRAFGRSMFQHTRGAKSS